MQMVMMIFRTSLQSEVLPLVEQEELPFTRFDGVQGQGATGGVSGSVPWGGSNTVLLLVVPDERLSRFHERVHQFQDGLKAQAKSVGVPFHIFVLPCIQWF
ncbi:MAG: hypothetical protein ABI856_13420 [Nitrospira sp.]